MLFRKLSPIFDKAFIYDSYSCRIGKGTHRAVRRLHEFLKKESKNNIKNCFVLKCDVKKFFDNVDQGILFELIKERSRDEHDLWLGKVIIRSFLSGLPLGNITSQLFANVYLNELDHFIKHALKVNYYIRYADDFVILSSDKQELEGLIPMIADFLQEGLKLTLHPGKVFIKRISSGVDFLGWVQFEDHRVLRNTTKKRMMEKLNMKNASSYVGLIKHGDSYKIKEKLLKLLEAKIP